MLFCIFCQIFNSLKSFLSLRPIKVAVLLVFFHVVLIFVGSPALRAFVQFLHISVPGSYVTCEVPRNLAFKIALGATISRQFIARLTEMSSQRFLGFEQFLALLTLVLQRGFATGTTELFGCSSSHVCTFGRPVTI